VDQVKTGIAGIGGNKGGAGVRLRIFDTPVTFCCAHLAAHASAAASAERDDNYLTIRDTMAFPPPTTPPPDYELPPVRGAPGRSCGADGAAEYGARPMDYARELALVSYSASTATSFGHASLMSAPHVFFFGDLNYRLNLGRQQVEEEIALFHALGNPSASSNAVGGGGDGPDSSRAMILAGLLQHDQLTISRARGTAFAEFDEASIEFRPTYKFDAGTSTYDTSEKQRVPAWCDRVLHARPSQREGGGSRSLAVNGYGCTEQLMASDHKPVQASFTLEVLVPQRLELPRLRSEFLRRESQGHAVAAGGVLEAAFCHVFDGERTAYSVADNRRIAAARAAGQASVRIDDVCLPSGAVLQFEVRFGDHARSSKWGAGATEMLQVNIQTENSRLVMEMAPQFVSGTAVTAVGGTAVTEPELSAQVSYHIISYHISYALLQCYATYSTCFCGV
jgi:hypothetical protein